MPRTQVNLAELGRGLTDGEQAELSMATRQMHPDSRGNVSAIEVDEVLADTRLDPLVDELLDTEVA